ncbi:hypothetical protein VF_1001 [Aliivibrio fischeri ES114]|uniref:Type VI secretion system baseplate subunit TssF n=1 Tax=Aliivibrio fischeri (strain ATCC 700601 / ES114) TaxID=312309 RepID=Q5E650_ALIF1|nr:type VI secretion system baseplate subunit TssF [Aliivibrio fischeri]AAW85496.1 hypothetical protein VF_1001 [Aliivibrio fischeri ES114]KLU80224.1 type VI secretion system protein ImpG [Aliivibrio fischeri]
MSFNHYYQSELAALRELGKSFSRENPALAPYLGQEGLDPDIERLFEGFAFLVGRLHQRLDNQLPELTHSLMRLLWPNYVQAIPAMSTLQFTPASEATQASIIKRGTEVLSQPIDGIQCKFKTCFDVDIYPVSLHSSSFTANGHGGIYQLRLELPSGIDLASLNMKQLRVHFNGDKASCLSLIMALCSSTTQAEFCALDKELEQINRSTFPPHSIKPVGFKTNEAIFDYPLNTFEGYRHIQEFFCYPEKYYYIDLTELPVWPAQFSQGCKYVDLKFTLDNITQQPFYANRVQPELFCTPIVNSFKSDTQPLLLNHRKDQYKITPVSLNDDSSTILSVKEVHGWNPGQKGRIDFYHFESFEHNENKNRSNYYSIRQEKNIVSGHFDTYLSFRSQHTFTNSVTVSIAVTACNGALAQRLSVNSITETTDQTTGSATFTNIRTVTPCYTPPIDKDGLWSLISNMSLNYLSLTKPEAFKRILLAYDFAGQQDDAKGKKHKRLIDGIVSISTKPCDMLYEGAPVRAMNTQLHLNTKHFLCEGELYLFSTVINEFLSLYTSMNSFNQLHVTSTDGGDYSWLPRMGQQPLI